MDPDWFRDPPTIYYHPDYRTYPDWFVQTEVELHLDDRACISAGRTRSPRPASYALFSAAVQCPQRTALMGMLIAHSGHSLVVAASSCFL